MNRRLPVRAASRTQTGKNGDIFLRQDTGFQFILQHGLRCGPSVCRETMATHPWKAGTPLANRQKTAKRKLKSFIETSDSGQESDIMPFKIADDPDTDYRALVRVGLRPHCANDYADAAVRHGRCWSSSLITRASDTWFEHLLTSAAAPVSRSRDISRRHLASLGIDVSSSMIALARNNVPAAQFITRRR